jgi:Flp pilus assembly protein TadG
MMHASYRAPRQRRRGVAAVELALLLPFVLLPLIYGMWVIGRIIEVQQVVVNAAREGARAASTGQYTNSQVQTIVLNYLGAAGINSSGVTPQVTSASGNDVSQALQMEAVTVTLSVPYSNVQWIAGDMNMSWLSPSPLIGSGYAMNVTTSWNSMVNVPLKINQTIPGAP